MGTKTWSCDAEGHQIEVTNYYSYLRFKAYESLKVDGTEVQRVDDTILRANSYLKYDLPVSSGVRTLEVIMGTQGFDVLCHILLDGELIGGDTTRDLSAWYPDEWDKVRERGFARFVAVRGIASMGIPFGLLMTLFNASGAKSLAHLISGGIVSGVLFGTFMGAYLWWSQSRPHIADKEHR